MVFNWKNVNIQGMGYVTGVVLTNNYPYDVYAKTDIGGAYKLNRSDFSWQSITDKFANNYSGGGVGVESIAIDKSSMSKVYIAVNAPVSVNNTKYNYSGDVLVSSDKGDTWSSMGLINYGINVNPNGDYRIETGERIGIDPNNADIIYYASRTKGLWKKTVSINWAQVSELPNPATLPNYLNPDNTVNLNIPGFTFVLFDPNSGTTNGATNKIYVGVHGSGVWASYNAGSTWQNIGGGTTPLKGVIASNGYLYVNFGQWANGNVPTSGSVKKYHTNGWVDITPDGNAKAYSTITILNNTNILVGWDNKLYLSINSGSTWVTYEQHMGAYDANHPSDPVNSTAPLYYQAYSSSGVSTLAFDPTNQSRVFWANGWGVAKTDNIFSNPPTFEWIMKGLEELDVNALKVPTKQKTQGGADLLIATQDMIGFRISERRTVPIAKFNPVNIAINPSYSFSNPSWIYYPNPFPHVAGATGLDISYKNPDHSAFVGFHQWQGYWAIHGKSSDGGQSWTGFSNIPINGTDRATAGQIAISPTNPNRMVWAPTWGTKPHYTIDAGNTWNICHDVTNNQDLPNSWPNSITPWLSSAILASDKQDPKGLTFYYYDGFKFYFSVDGGVNWSVGATNLPQYKIHSSIVPKPTIQNEVWMSFAKNPEDLKGNKLYKSVDKGQNFSIVSSVNSCEYITFGKGKTNPYIYIFGRINSAIKDTVYKSVDNGFTWTAVSDPNQIQFPGINGIEADMRTTDLVYISTSGRGVFYCEPGIDIA